MQRLLFLITLALLLTLAVFTGCKTSGTLEGGFDAGPIGVKGGVTWEPKKEFKIEGQLPPGDCLQIDFYDADGKIAGTVKTTLPAVGPLPEGAAGPWSAQIVPCDDTPEELVHAGPSATKMVKRRFFYWSPNPNLLAWDPARNTTLIVDLWVGKTTKPETTHKILQRIVTNGVGSAPPPFAEIIHYAAVKPVAHGDAQLVVARSKPYSTHSISSTGSNTYQVNSGTTPGWHWLGYHMDIDPAVDDVSVLFNWGSDHFQSSFGWQ
jgi:hypothetical protein